MARTRRAAASTMALVLLVLAPVWAPAPPAAAHDALAASEPAQSGSVEALPSRAVLTFTAPVSAVEEVIVTGPDGSVTNGSPTFAGSEVRQNLWAGPDGEYEMSYRVVSSDGHEITGDVTFEVGPVATSGGTAEVQQAAPEAEGVGSRLRGVVLPGVLVVLAGAVVVLVRRRATRAS
jgi:copper resistance protein C